MSLLPTDVYYGINNPIFIKAPLEISTARISSITTNTIVAISTFTKNLLADYSETTEAFIYDILTIDNQQLTANATSLLLNGIPLVTTANLSSIQDWAIYPQVSTVQGNNKSTIGLSYLEASTIATKNFTSSNIFTQNLMAFNIVNFTSTVIDVYESTIQADIKLANISTANIKNLYLSTGNFSTLNSINGSFNIISTGTASINTLTGVTANFCNFTASSITVSSIVSPPVTAGSFSSLTVVSNTNTGSLTVGSNNTTSFAAAPTFSDGGNFNGTRPNFNTGIVTSGANNFNNQNLDNVGRITANTVFVGSPNYVNIQTSSYTKILNDRGADVGGNSLIDLTAQYGAATRINLTAGASSAFAVTPTQIITLTANGATSLSQNAVGGRVSIVANSGSGSGCNILGFGQIDLTAYSSLPFAGVIKESAGSILAYSGLTSPLAGVYGYSFYSALNCLSLTAGATVPSGSYPGVVYLRGDNGTKVVNGFFSDTISNSGTTTTSNIITNSINSFSGQGITIQAPVNNINFIASTATFQCGIAGNFSVPSIINLSSVNGLPYSPGGGGGGIVSSYTNLYTSSLTVSSINGLAYPPASTWISTASSRLNMNSYPITDTTGFLNLIVSSATAFASQTLTSTSIDLVQSGGAGYIRRNAAGNIIDTAVGNIQTQATSTINTVPHTYFTGDINVKSVVGLSSINGAAYTGGGGGSVVSSFTNLATSSFIVSSINNNVYPPPGAWVGTAASDLNMQGYAITGGSIRLTDLYADLIYMGGGNVIICNGYGTTITLDSGGANTFANAANYTFTSAYNDLVELGGSSPYIYPAGGSFVVNCLIQSAGASNGVLYVGGGSGITANTIDLVTNSAGTPGYSGNITITALSSVNITSGSSNYNTAPIISNACQTLFNTVSLSTINTCPETFFTGDVRVSSLTRTLIGTGIPQPVLQTGFVSSSGASGSITINLPTRYTTQQSYTTFGNMVDSPAAQIFTSSISRGSFILGWSSGGGGNHLFNWLTAGT